MSVREFTVTISPAEAMDVIETFVVTGEYQWNALSIGM